MELRHLRYFLAVAEELNFTRAAKRLNIAQPPLTQQIKALEAEMGVTLFDRTGYRVELTDAGKSFVPQVARILADVRNAVLIAKRASLGDVGHVRVGFTESASFNPLVTAAFRNFRVAYPDVEVSLEEGPSTVLASALREGRVDAAFLRPPLRTGEGIALHMIDEEEMVVAVASSHPLAAREDLEIKDLADETFVLYPRTERPGLADTVIAASSSSSSPSPRRPASTTSTRHNQSQPPSTNRAADPRMPDPGRPDRTPKGGYALPTVCREPTPARARGLAASRNASSFSMSWG